MYTWICPHCGREVPPSYDACPDCAATAASVAQTGGELPDAGPLANAAPPAPAMAMAMATATAPAMAPPPGRVASHLRMLMVLWLAQGVLRVLSMVPGLLLWLPVSVPSAGVVLGVGNFFPLQSPLTGAGWAFLLVSMVWAGSCLLVARGLLDCARWAWTYTIIVSAIWLLDFPLGTALSIYTLWVLLPESSENEYRQLAMQ